MKKFIKEYSAHIAWVIALASMIGSLYFSEVFNFAPCVLCWYQRIIIYPLVLLIPVGIMLKDKRLASYILPLTVVGLIVSIFQNLLYYKVIPEAIMPCVDGVSCTTKYIDYFGFLTIPLLSLLSLIAITVLMVIYKKQNHE